MNKMNRLINELLETQCYIIDLLPEQVPADSKGQFFKVEGYFLKEFEQYGPVSYTHLTLPTSDLV